MKNYLALA